MINAQSSCGNMHGERTRLRARFDAPSREHLPQPPLPSPFVLSIPYPSALQNQQFHPRETRPNKAEQTKTHLNKAFAPREEGASVLSLRLRGKERWVRWQNQAKIRLRDPMAKHTKIRGIRPISYRLALKNLSGFPRSFLWQDNFERNSMFYV